MQNAYKDQQILNSTLYAKNMPTFLSFYLNSVLKFIVPYPYRKHIINIFSCLINLPCDWGCIGFPKMITSSGLINIYSDITQAVNKVPLSLYCLLSIPISVKASIR